jgi:hypothetical protein
MLPSFYAGADHGARFPQLATLNNATKAFLDSGVLYANCGGTSCHKLATSSNGLKQKMADFCGFPRVGILSQKSPKLTIT